MDLPVDLNAIQNLEPSLAEIRTDGKNAYRFTSLKEVATGLGARGGLAWRYNQINNTLEVNSRKMDQVWSFRALLISKPYRGMDSTNYAILPPVLSESSNTYDQQSDTRIILADHTYKMELPARFVAVAPTWRDYLVQKFDAPEMPHPSLLPKNSEERAVWKAAVNDGWNSGIKQADAIFTVNLNRLKRDYEGMVRYRKLLTMNMVSEPFVAESKNGVTGNGDELNIDERILMITATPRLNPNALQWTPVVVKESK